MASTVGDFPVGLAQIRSHLDCAIWVMVREAIRSGFVFYESECGAILCDGGDEGLLPGRFFFEAKLRLLIDSELFDASGVTIKATKKAGIPDESAKLEMAPTIGSEKIATTSAPANKRALDLRAI